MDFTKYVWAVLAGSNALPRELIRPSNEPGYTRPAIAFKCVRALASSNEARLRDNHLALLMPCSELGNLLPTTVLEMDSICSARSGLAQVNRNR